MTHDHSALITQLDALKGADPASVFAELIRAGLQALIDAEATEVLGAGRYERTAERTNYRNGNRTKTVATTSGDVEGWIQPVNATLGGSCWSESSWSSVSAGVFHARRLRGRLLSCVATNSR